MLALPRLEFSTLTALNPLDGRYQEKGAALQHFFSEYALIRYRVQVEVYWLITLAEEATIPELQGLPTSLREELHRVVDHFELADAQAIKKIEQTTNHDVKAVEYWLKQRFAHDLWLKNRLEFFHFGCTSEDINNLCHGLMLQQARTHVLLPVLESVLEKLTNLSVEYSDIAMLSRTHGQAATPTTLGKEFANWVVRLRRQLSLLQEVPILGKMNGAVGNYNAHMVVYPQTDWEGLAQRFVTKLGLAFNPYTTQIEPHDYMAELFDGMSRINTILIDLNRDLWGYISLGYFRQKAVAGEVGSSTMPHKINPIDFENAEGNLGLANTLLQHLSEKLPISRWQRDLTDSTVLRNMGVAWGYSLLAYTSCLKGLSKLIVDREAIATDLDANWEVLAEPIQMMLRRYGIPNPYEQLKSLTRGKSGIQAETLRDFIKQLGLPDIVQQQLCQLEPATYLGKAAELAKRVQ